MRLVFLYLHMLLHIEKLFPVRSSFVMYASLPAGLWLVYMSYIYHFRMLSLITLSAVVVSSLRWKVVYRSAWLLLTLEQLCYALVLFRVTLIDMRRFTMICRIIWYISLYMSMIMGCYNEWVWYSRKRILVEEYKYTTYVYVRVWINVMLCLSASLGIMMTASASAL